CGVLAVAYFSHSRAKGRQAIGGAIIFGILLICFALSKSYHLSLILACSLGIASQFYITVINAILQVNLPDQLRGRVMGIYGLTWELMLGGRPNRWRHCRICRRARSGCVGRRLGCRHGLGDRDILAEHAALGTVTAAMLRRHHRHELLWLRKK